MIQINIGRHSLMQLSANILGICKSKLVLELVRFLVDDNSLVVA